MGVYFGHLACCTASNVLRYEVFHARLPVVRLNEL